MSASPSGLGTLATPTSTSKPTSTPTKSAHSTCGCEQDSESLEAGNYVATAEFGDAEPVKLRMILSD
jgi:hypothetical protein